MSPFKIGNIYRLPSELGLADHAKFCVMIGTDNTHVGVLYINSKIAYTNDDEECQGLSYLIPASDYSFLSHDSYIDCSDICEVEKRHLNNLISQRRASIVSCVTDNLLSEIISIARRARSIPVNLKRKYSLI